MTEPLTINYRNYRGEIAQRRIIPYSIRYGTTEWHPEPGWLLKAWDFDKQAEREFAMKDINLPIVEWQAGDAAISFVNEVGDAIGMQVKQHRFLEREVVLFEIKRPHNDLIFMLYPSEAVMLHKALGKMVSS